MTGKIYRFLLTFLSTLSLRRATGRGANHATLHWYISIHALLAESDTIKFQLNFINQEFLSTLSLRRATIRAPEESRQRQYFYPRSPCGERRWPLFESNGTLHISIHALLAESDNRSEPSSCRLNHFYPRSPCGERPPRALRHCTTYLFLSTLSLRRATHAPNRRPYHCNISIHALLAESDIAVDEILLGHE